jgi:hypothetical protein
MARFAATMPIAIALCLFGTDMSQAQPARVPASLLGPPAGPLAPHPYKSALGAVGNYQSCGVDARRTSYLVINAELRSIEAAAEAKGLGPTLARLRREYQALLAVSTMMACAHGPAAALAGARRALQAFRAWVAAQPARP